MDLHHPIMSKLWDIGGRTKRKKEKKRIPATNFTATFLKIVYLRIKRCLDKGKVNYSRFSIVQASNLKEILKEKKLVR